MMEKLSNIEYLILDYLWCSPWFHINTLIAEEWMDSDENRLPHCDYRWRYHNLSIPELSKVVYRLYQQGIIIFSHQPPIADEKFNSFMNISYSPVHLTEKKLCAYFTKIIENTGFEEESSEPFIQRYMSTWHIYLYLSKKGQQLWEEKIQPDWGRFHLFSSSRIDDWTILYGADNIDSDKLSHLLESDIHYNIIQSSSYTHAEKIVEHIFSNNYPIEKDIPIDTKVFKPWQPQNVYWKQLPQVFLISVPYNKQKRHHWYESLSLLERSNKINNYKKLSKWRREWLLDGNKNLAMDEAGNPILCDREFSETD